MLMYKALAAIRSFFDKLSEPGDIENIKGLVMPSFYRYLKGEFIQAGDFRPVYRLDTDNVRFRRYMDPWILLGRPKIFRRFDIFDFAFPANRPWDEFDIFRSTPPMLDPSLPDFLALSHYGPVALASGWPFVMSPNTTLLQWGWTMLRRSADLREKIRNIPMDRRNAFTLVLDYWKEMNRRTEFPGMDGSLAFIVDLALTMPVETYIVERKEGRDSIQQDKPRGYSSQERTFIVTLRSNHVTPGWKFNLDTVRWYIQDINLTVRQIPRI
jgi:hypothetical protein